MYGAAEAVLLLRALQDLGVLIMGSNPKPVEYITTPDGQCPIRARNAH
jgi:hypothetical protein